MELAILLTLVAVGLAVAFFYKKDLPQDVIKLDQTPPAPEPEKVDVAPVVDTISVTETVNINLVDDTIKLVEEPKQPAKKTQAKKAAPKKTVGQKKKK